MIPRSALRDDIGENLERAQGELFEVEMLHADRSDAWLHMGVIDTDRGRLEEAEEALRQALEVDPGTNPARVNLADFARNRGDEEAVGHLLRAANCVPGRSGLPTSPPSPVGNRAADPRP